MGEALTALLPEGAERPAGEGTEDSRGRWLDVLPCTGIVTARLASERKGFRFDVVERSPEVAEFCAGRVSPRGAALAWPASGGGTPTPEAEAYDVVSASSASRGPRRRAGDARGGDGPLAEARGQARGFVSARSFHPWTERLRPGRGPKGVEYVLAPDPNVGPFEPLTPGDVSWLSEAGLSEVGASALNPYRPRGDRVPNPEHEGGARQGAPGKGSALGAAGCCPGWPVATGGSSSWWPGAHGAEGPFVRSSHL